MDNRRFINRIADSSAEANEKEQTAQLVWAYGSMIGFIRICNQLEWSNESDLFELGFHQAASWGLAGVSTIDVEVFTDGERYLLLIGSQSDAIEQVWCETLPDYLALLRQLLPMVEKALRCDRLTENLQ